MIDFSKLAAPFPPAVVQWRVGSTTADKSRGMALAFIDARAVQQRFDDVVGPEYWSCYYTHLGDTTLCMISVYCGGDLGWVAKSDGAGATDFEAEKGALSSAFKRAAVPWGVGRYLYDLPTPWVRLEQRGNHPIIPEGEKQRLAKELERIGSVPMIGVAPQLTPETPADSPADDGGHAGASYTDAEIDRAHAAYPRLRDALRNATSARVLDDIERVQATEFALLARIYPAEHQKLLDLADKRRTEIIQGQSP